LHNHRGQGRHQRFLAPRVAIEQGGREFPVPIPRHTQFQLANAGDEVAAVVTGTVTRAAFRPPPGAAPRHSVISPSNISCSASFINAFIRSRSPATASTANNFVLGFFLVVMVALLSGFKVSLIHQPLP
jgi:hypothetical protein